MITFYSKNNLSKTIIVSLNYYYQLLKTISLLAIICVKMKYMKPYNCKQTNDSYLMEIVTLKHISKVINLSRG